MKQPTILKLHQLILLGSNAYVVCPHQPLLIGTAVIAPNPKTKSLDYGIIGGRGEHSLRIHNPDHDFLSPIAKASKVIISQSAMRFCLISDPSGEHLLDLSNLNAALEQYTHQVWVEMEFDHKLGMLIPRYRDGHFHLRYENPQPAEAQP